VVHPNSMMTGRTRLFSSVEVFDHERGSWVTWAPLTDAAEVHADDVLQAAIDDGFDDVRLVLHATGSSADSHWGAFVADRNRQPL